MNTTLRTACLAALLALYGCGGGGGGGGSEDPPPVDPVVDPTALTLSGVVTDDAIPNATVNVTVGGESFTADAMTDADGAFSVDIESDDPDALVSCEAVDDNGVHFVSLPATFAELEAQAADGVVTGMSITNVTTAHYVLAVRATADGSIDDADELADAVAGVDATELVELAAAIKVVVENRDGVAMPAEYADTLEFATAIADGDSTFVADLEVSNPGTLDEAADAVLNDGNATMAFVAGSSSGVYVDETAGATIALLDGGQGWSEAGADVASIGSWHVDEDGKLYILFPGADHQVDTVTLLGRAGGYATVATSAGSLMDDVVDGVSYATYAYASFGEGFDAADFDGTFVLGDDGDTSLVFLAGGMGHDADANGAPQAEFAWQVVADGRLVIQYEDAVVNVYRLEDGSVLVVRTDAAGVASAMSVTQLDSAS
jgi:hypothetical protein